MADSYRGHSRGSESSSGSSSGSRHGQYQPVPSSQYSSAASAQYSYYPAPGQPGAPVSSHPSYGHYSTSSPPHLEGSASSHGHHRTSSGVVPRHATYPGHAPSAFASASERASKRQRAGTAPDQGAYMQAQWADAPAQGDPRCSASNSHNSRGSRHGRDSSVSNGYNSPGYSHSHDPYGQQLLQAPSIPGAATRDPHMYGMRHSQAPSSEYEEEEEEHVDHGPTELPPRTYSGKSKYDPPRKPGKIPGSAMDYLPILEARFDRLETAIDRYVDYRGQRALSNSILPGMDTPEEGPSSSSRHSRGSSRR